MCCSQRLLELVKINGLGHALAGYALRGPAHDRKEKEVTGHPLRYESVEETAGGRTTVPPISETLKEVNGGLTNSVDIQTVTGSSSRPLLNPLL